jgi:pimeloyl-ACP methyl ester carboxylesterase
VEFRPEAARVKAPVLVVHGTAEPGAPIEGGRAWVAQLPTARIVAPDGDGLAVDSAGRLYAATGQVIRVISPQGQSSVPSRCRWAYKASASPDGTRR